jgi:hypothetical protein
MGFAFLLCPPAWHHEVASSADANKLVELPVDFSFICNGFWGFFELGSEGDVIHLLGLSWPWVKRNSLPGKWTVFNNLNKNKVDS